MKFVVEHESVLKLWAGPDFLLKSGSLALASTGFLTLLFSPVTLAIKIPALAACAAIGFLIYYWDHEASGCMLNIFPDGRVRWESGSGKAGRALLSTGHWISPRYLVMTTLQNNRSLRFLVSRSLQPDENFRVLRTWARLGPPKGAPVPGGEM